MRTHTNDYKEALVGVREIDEYLRVFENNTWTRYDNNNLEMVKPILNATLFKTVMKELDIEAKTKLEIGTIVDYKNGLKIDEDYEYMHYGKYKVYEVEYRPDTKTYYHICYDKMLDAMVEYEAPNVTYPITVKNYILAIAGKCGLIGHTPIIYDGDFANQDKQILKDYFSEGNYTYRDILDYLCEVVGGWLYIDNNNDLKLKYPTETKEELNADYLNYINISFEKKYGPVNSLVFARANELDNIEYKDDDSITNNGLCRIKFSDNPLLSGTNRNDYMTQLKDKIIGLEFYLNDLESKGITYLELGDLYTFAITDDEINALKSGLVKSGMRKAQGNTKRYKCLMLNDETEFSGGIKELIYTDEPEEDNSTNIITNPSTNSLKNAEILVNKNAAEIVLKVNNDGKMVQVRLDADANNGTQFDVDADNINLTAEDIINLIAGNSINLTSKNITINSTNFNVDSNGNVGCNNLTINGGKISVEGYSTNNPYLDIGRGQATEPYGTLAWDRGLTVYDYRVTTGTPDATIKTEYSGGYAELHNSTCSAYYFNNLSLAEKKQDFEPLKSGLEILKDIDIYKYRYKGEEGKKKIGFIIGDNYKYSKEITSKDNDSVDLYSFVSVCCKAIQEQQEQIEKLKEEIKSLKGDGK